MTEADGNPAETAPPIVAEETGVAMHGKYPLNHRLRAEALAKAGRKSDPDDLITDSVIEATRDRIDQEKAAAEREAAKEKAAEAKAEDKPETITTGKPAK